jgi:5-methylcytosine-specific restriction endonuclease McrA
MSKRGRTLYSGVQRPSLFSNKGITHTYGEKWKLTSSIVRQMYNYRCMAEKVGLKPCFLVFKPPFSKLLHTHHIIEKSKGGTDSIHNLIPLCVDCHGLIHKRKVGKSITAKQKMYCK